MSLYQNFEPSARTLSLINSQCPRCNQASVPQGMYVKHTVKVPLRIRIFFITITLDIGVTMHYCPKCGFLRVELAS